MANFTADAIVIPAKKIFVRDNHHTLKLSVEDTPKILSRAKYFFVDVIVCNSLRKKILRNFAGDFLLCLMNSFAAFIQKSCIMFHLGL